MIKVISFKICPFVQRVTALLAAKGLEYEVQYISLSDKPDWFLRLSPTGQVPVLVTASGQALFESDAIVEYIDEIAAPLQPSLSPEQRAVNRAWAYQASKHYLLQCGTMRSVDEDALMQGTARLGKAFARLEAVLGDGPYFAGQTPGNVDLAWLVLLHRADIISRHTGFDMLLGFPKVQTLQAQLLATGLAESSVAADFEDKFTAFYLSGQAWLGNAALGGSDTAA